MRTQPNISTRRLLLRPFVLADAADVQRLAGDPGIARTTLSVPHPYGDGMAAEWISTHQAGFEAGTLANFAIAMQAGGSLVGSIGLTIRPEFERAELGYWIAAAHWNRGYATEAAAAVIDYGFATLGLNKIFATHMARNPASGRVMQKLGMRSEGLLTQHVKKWEKYEDVAIYGLLRAQWQAGRHLKG